jgi:hypothetical protein
MRGGDLGFEAGRQTKAHGVTGQAGGVVVLMDVLQGLQRMSVARVRFQVVDAFVTLGAGLRAGELSGRPGYFEERVTGEIREREIAIQVGRTGRLPGRIGERVRDVELIVTRRAVPRDVDAVGGLGDAGQDRATGKAAGLGDGQMRNFLRAGGRRKSDAQRQSQPELMCALLH